MEVSLHGARTALQSRWLTRGNSRDRQPAYSPDGEWLIFSSDRSGSLDLWEISLRSGAVRRITEDPADDFDPAFTPDGKRIVWSSNRTGHFEIWIANADGSAARQVTRHGTDSENPTATREGWIVYHYSNLAEESVWKIREDGSEATRLVAGVGVPEVSPDGNMLLRTGSTRTSRSGTCAWSAYRMGPLCPFGFRMPIALDGCRMGAI